MELIRGMHNLPARHRGGVVTIGNFDGVHRGHQAMLEVVVQRARELGGPATVITFEPSPREFFLGAAAPSRLMRLREKVDALGLYGIERLVILRFDEKLSKMSASAFEQQLLHDGLGARHVVVGHDFHYSRNRAGTLATLREAGGRLDFTVEEVEPFLLDGERVSSSLVREALGAGQLTRAASLIGRPYRMTGRVRRGQQLGRTLGYPTANLWLQRKVVPLWGIFAVRVCGPGFYDHPAVVSLGTRPTINGTDPLLEVHLFDFDADLYGEYLSVDFVQRLRDEKKFESLDLLVEQMHLDSAQARAALAAAAAGV